VCHDVAPVAGRISNREKNGFVLFDGFIKRFFIPCVPVDGVIIMVNKAYEAMLNGTPRKISALR